MIDELYLDEWFNPNERLAIDERGTFVTRLWKLDQPPVEEIVPGYRWTYESWRYRIFEGIADTPHVKFGRSWKMMLGVPTWSVEATT